MFSIVTRTSTAMENMNAPMQKNISRFCSGLQYSYILCQIPT